LQGETRIGSPSATAASTRKTSAGGRLTSGEATKA
jgi:hypothetical protein